MFILYRQIDDDDGFVQPRYVLLASGATIKELLLDPAVVDVREDELIADLKAAHDTVSKSFAEKYPNIHAVMQLVKRHQADPPDDDDDDSDDDPDRTPVEPVVRGPG